VGYGYCHKPNRSQESNFEKWITNFIQELLTL
jgi:hypothetical protein